MKPKHIRIKLSEKSMNELKELKRRLNLPPSQNDNVSELDVLIA